MNKGLAKNPKQPFFNTIKAYCLLKTFQHEQSREILLEINKKQTDHYTVLYMVYCFVAFGWNAEVTNLLESVSNIHAEKLDLGEQ